jgi:hypothetical protein
MELFDPIKRRCGKCADDRVIESWSSLMNVRHWLGDVGLAVLLALPTATLASPSAIWKSRPTTTTTPVHIAVPDQSRLGFPS